MKAQIKILPRMLQQVDPNWPKCEQKVSMQTVELGRGRNKKLKDKCECFAKIVINGVPMCLKHAQQEALKILIARMP